MGIELVIITVILLLVIVVTLSAKRIKSDRRAGKHKSIPDEPDRNENVY